MADLKGKIALVVGGGADGPPGKDESLAIGNGRAAAIECARQGAAVMVADRNLGAAEATVARIREEGFRGEAVACDVLDDVQCLAAVKTTVAAFGGLHLLVNNVGIADLTDVTGTSDDEFTRILAVNVRGHFRMIKHALPEMIAAGGGAVVNISSLNALRTGGAGVAYDTSKAALLGLSRNTAVSAAAQNVRINCVLPGIINSTMVRKVVGDGELPPEFAQRIPLRRLGSPWEVAKMVAFLLSDDASYITAAEYLVDGGMAAAL